MMDYTPHMTESQLYRAAFAMEKYGGSFAAYIAQAFFHADGHNKKRLLAAFGDLFVQFAPTPDTTEGETA